MLSTTGSGREGRGKVSRAFRLWSLVLALFLVLLAAASVLAAGRDQQASALLQVAASPPSQDEHEFELAKAVSHPSVEAGGALAYTLTWEVSGTEAASGVVLSDTIPPHTSFLAATPSYTWHDGALNWDLGNPNPGETDFVTFTVQVERPLEDGTVITNSALISDSEGVSATAEVTSLVSNWHALTLTKVTALDAAYVGVPLTYNLLYEAAGSEVAEETIIVDWLPDHTVLDDCDPGCQGPVSGVVTWTLGDLLTDTAYASGSVTLVVNVVPTAPLGAPIINAAFIIDEPGQQDEAEAVVVVRQSLSLTKEAPAGVEAGGALAFTLTLENHGPRFARPVLITDRIPRHTEFVGCSECEGPAVGVVTWTYPFLPQGAIRVEHLMVTVTDPPTIGHTVTNTAWYSSHRESGKSQTVTTIAGSRIISMYLPIVLNNYGSTPPQPPECENVIQNPGFENGPDPTPWTQHSVGGWGLIYPSSEMPVHSGGWGAWLAGYNDAHDELCQQITIPTEALTVTATWWWQVTTYDPGDPAADTVRAEIRQEGQPTMPLKTLDNLSTTVGEWMAVITDTDTVTGVIQLCFVAQTDGNLITNFYLDDVDLEVCTPGGGE